MENGEDYQDWLALQLADIFAGHVISLRNSERGSQEETEAIKTMARVSTILDGYFQRGNTGVVDQFNKAMEGYRGTLNTIIFGKKSARANPAS